jgi:CheY-like chemotaxis protein
MVDEANGTGVVAAHALRVLIVEDNADVRETLRMLLDVYGHYTEMAVDGIEGVERALAGEFDLAFIDIGLPRLNGLETARRIRARLGPSIRLVACTAWGEPEDYERARLAGFDDLLIKPVAWEQLERWLKKVAGEHPA